MAEVNDLDSKNVADERLHQACHCEMVYKMGDYSNTSLDPTAEHKGIVLVLEVHMLETKGLNGRPAVVGNDRLDVLEDSPAVVEGYKHRRYIACHFERHSAPHTDSDTLAGRRRHGDYSSADLGFG